MTATFDGTTVANYPKCRERRKCFARRAGECTILTSNYPRGKCPFCKEHRGNDGLRIREDWKVGKPHSKGLGG